MWSFELPEGYCSLTFHTLHHKKHFTREILCMNGKHGIYLFYGLVSLELKHLQARESDFMEFFSRTIKEDKYFYFLIYIKMRIIPNFLSKTKTIFSSYIRREIHRSLSHREIFPIGQSLRNPYPTSGLKGGQVDSRW